MVRIALKEGTTLSPMTCGARLRHTPEAASSPVCLSTVFLLTLQQTFQNTVRSCKMGEILRVKCRPGKAHIFNHDADVDQRKHISKFILAVA